MYTRYTHALLTLLLTTGLLLTPAAPGTNALDSGSAPSGTGVAEITTADASAELRVNHSNTDENIRPANCQEVLDLNPQAMDGTYTLYLNHHPDGAFPVFCLGMLTGTPTEYLPLTYIGETQNFSRAASGGAWRGVDVVTRFEKIGFNPRYMTVDIGGLRTKELPFSVSTGHLVGAGHDFTSLGYAWAGSCKALWDSSGTANVDLRGTPFAMDPSVTFSLGGYYPAGSSIFSSQRQVVYLTGGGFCGGNRAASPIKLKHINAKVIVGRIVDDAGNSMADVEVSAGPNSNTTTDSTGVYTLTNVFTGAYTVTPTKTGYIFSPPTRMVTVPPDATGQDFTGASTSALPPLLVVHGIQTFSRDGGYSCDMGVQSYPGTATTLGDLPGWFTADYQVWIAHLTSSAKHTPSIESNARCLRDQVDEVYRQSGNQPITIIAHSMGGLVTRGCLAFPDCRDKVRAVYTLGSPHAGLNSALVGKVLIKLGEAYLKAHGLPIPVGDGICLWQSALCQMSVEEMPRFNGNPANANQGNIRYTFIGGDASPATYGLGWLISLIDGPHDGIVGRSSAVGWVYPFNQPLPWDWTGGTQLPNLARYWTDEVHATLFDGFAYYQNRGGGESRSYDCIAYREGFKFTSQPPWCQTASPTILAAESAGPNLSQTTTSIDGAISTGQTVTHTLSVDTAATSLFTLAWSDGTVAFTLLRPDDQAVTPAYAAAHPDEVAFTSAVGSAEFPAFASYAFTSTLAGDWQLQIGGTDVGDAGAGYVGFVAMETARSLTVSQDRALYAVGDTATFTATLQGGGGGIAGATVTAALNRPDGITETLTLADVGGGVYRTNYLVPDAGGRVVMSVVATGSDGGVPFTRQEERIWTIAPDTAQFTAIAADRGVDDDGNGRFESLRVDVQVNVTQPATYTLSARLSKGGVSIASTAVYSEIAAAGVYTLPLSFDGSNIWAAQQDGPYSVADAVLNNISIGSVPVASAETLHTTAAYAVNDFAAHRIYVPLIQK